MELEEIQTQIENLLPDIKNMPNLAQIKLRKICHHKGHKYPPSRSSSMARKNGKRVKRSPAVF